MPAQTLAPVNSSTSHLEVYIDDGDDGDEDDDDDDSDDDNDDDDSGIDNDEDYDDDDTDDDDGILLVHLPPRVAHLLGNILADGHLLGLGDVDGGAGPAGPHVQLLHLDLVVPDVVELLDVLAVGEWHSLAASHGHTDANFF